MGKSSPLAEYLNVSTTNAFSRSSRKTRPKTTNSTRTAKLYDALKTSSDMDGRGNQEITKLTQMKSKVNRLRRSPKSTSPNPARICQTAEFKTPTRPARGQFRRVIPEDSPTNDPELHQDIIWDTTSPSPVRHGRGHRRAANVRSVDISDIANRIAPKNGRLKEADSSLLQWIGDSAIPCTPEVQQPKVKTMSTKQNTVEDLMRLAKQFDFNMRQDEAQEPHSDGPKSSVQEGLTHHENLTTSSHNGFAMKIGTVAVESSKEKPVEERALYQEMDDDLDFLFDGPTQQLSGCLSQMPEYRTRNVPELTTEKNIAVVKACNSEKNVCLFVAAKDNAKQVNNVNDFEDDWNNDSFLEDSLVFEMTQNPDLFAAPRDCSTQKQNGENRNDFNSNTYSNARRPDEPINEVKCGTVQGQKAKNRQTFQLEAFSSGHQTPPKPHGGLQKPGNLEVGYTRQTISVSTSHSNTNQNQQYQHKSEIQKLQVVQNSSASKTVFLTHFQSHAKETPQSTSLSTIKPSHSSKPVSTHPSLNSGGVKQNKENAITGQDGLSDILDDDLDSFFASDDIWNEGVEDDDLFCEACDNLEVSGNPSHHVKSPATVHQPTSKTQPKPPQSDVSQNKTYISSKMDSQQTVFAHPNSPRKLPANVSMSSTNTSAALYRPKTQAVNSGPLGLNINGSYETTRPSGPSSNGPYKFTQVGHSSVAGSGNCAAVRTQQGHDRGVLATLQSAPVVTKVVYNTEAVRCSDAEIERKKQQALERRRLRVMSNQNLRAPF